MAIENLLKRHMILAFLILINFFGYMSPALKKRLTHTYTTAPMHFTSISFTPNFGPNFDLENMISIYMKNI
jgi:hypothetical protein